MSDFTKPTLTSTYTNFITELKARDNTISSLFSDGTTHTGTYPVRAIRWNNSGYFQRRNSNNNGWERLEGNGGTHYFENIETGALTATGGATITGAATATGQIQANNFNVTGTTKPANGFYLPASNEVRFTTNSTDRFTIEANGQVGIGTVNPAYTLDITGNFRIQNGSSETRFEIGTGGSGDRSAYVDLVGDDTNTDYGLRLVRSGGKNGTSLLRHKGTGDLIFDCLKAEDNTGFGADVLFRHDENVKFKIKDTGNDTDAAVGIGNKEFTPDQIVHLKYDNGGAMKIHFENTEGDAYITYDANKLKFDGNTIEFREQATLSNILLRSTPSLFDIKTNAKVNGTLQSTGNVTAPKFVGEIDATNGDFSGTLEADAITVNGTALNTVIAGVTVTNATNATTATTATSANQLGGKSLSTSSSRFNCVAHVSDIGVLENGKRIDFHTVTSNASGDQIGTIHYKDDGNGRFEFTRSVFPETSGLDLGDGNHRWNNLYVNDLKLSNKGSANDVDGTWGDWTLQEAEETIFMINHRNGKKYKINMTEIAN